MWNKNNIYLNGPHAPLHEESIVTDLEIEGCIPPELSGTLYRITASPRFEPLDTEHYHWFEGDGMVVALSLREGKARIHNRYVQTAGLVAETKAGRALYGPIMNGGAQSVILPGNPPFKNAANTNVTVFGGRLLVFTEIDIPHELRVDSLETVGMYDFGGVKGPVTAHSRVDPDNGDLLFYGVTGGRLNWYRADASGKLVETYGFDLGLNCGMHDFAVTKDYAIFFVNPSLLDSESAARGGPILIWDPNINCRVAVMRRKDGVVQWFDAPDTFANTHFLNAYQDGDELVVDGNRAPRFGFPKANLDKAAPRQWHVPAFPWRWRLNLATGAYKAEQVSDLNSEFPRHNETRVGKRVDIGYYGATKQPEFLENWFFDYAVKQDFRNGKTEFQNLGGALTSPGEMVFAPRPGGTAEDDGWVLGLWWDQDRDRTELVILNAQDFAGEPAARVKLPYRVPMGTHGNWIAD